MRTASARSSFLRPFSSSLSDVAASLAAVPSLVTRWTRMNFWTSALERNANQRDQPSLTREAIPQGQARNARLSLQMSRMIE